MRAKKVDGPTGNLIRIVAGESEITILLSEIEETANQYVGKMRDYLAGVLAGPVYVPKKREPKE